ncbi:DUF2235 domain-containing protein [Jiella sp. M17.18]|uniref:DUF2235 domain-containing protein n=1 Tax=Jiella sp. M17.18 TaxID=3234247 RepID=UPI0034DF1368
MAMTNLAVFCDGTWNTPDDLDQGVPAPTNVVRMYNALAETDADGAAQKKYYHPGVGTDGGLVDRLVGGGTGEGLDQNIMSAYRWLCVEYQPDDRIYLIGFSRGAYTVRSVAGMIARCGLLDLRDPALDHDVAWRDVRKVFDAYRNKQAPNNLQGTYHGDGPGAVPIHFLGVWDTVGALGIPDDLALLNLLDSPRKYQFHDTRLNSQVLHARHAVALDEIRSSFRPALWSNVDSHADARQVWFPGVHSDVGGGYSRTGLSDGALLWMIGEAEAQGLAIRGNAKPQIAPDPLGVLHDSLTGVFKSLETRPRSTPEISEASREAGVLHESALRRQQDPPLTQHPYWPTDSLQTPSGRKVDIFARQTWNDTGIYLRAGQGYKFSATGQWVDGSMKCGPDGLDDGRFELREAVHLASAGLSYLEKAYRSVTGNQSAEVWWTRRNDDERWFALIGVVANGYTEEDGTEVEHEAFLIGTGTTVTPKRSGYLYCYANDTWQTYANNRGSVSLTVSRS